VLSALLVLAALAVLGSDAVGAPTTPFVQVGAKFEALDEVGAAGFGASVALSGDGGTALVGGPDDNSIHGMQVVLRGAVWTFARSGSQWQQVGGKLAGTDGFGYSVALSADGQTALVGAPYASSQVGAVYVYRRSGAGWIQEAELTPSSPAAPTRFGRNVALSADGTTALIGGSYDDGGSGAAWVFVRTGSGWSQQGPKLTGSGGNFGASVALSRDGNVAAVGAPSDALGQGAVWTFVRSGETWSALGGKLTAASAIGTPSFGASVALSADGRTFAVGGPDDNGTGAVWVYHRSFLVLPVAGGGSGVASSVRGVLVRGGAQAFPAWLLGGKLTVSGLAQNAFLGAGVVLAADGSALVAGAPGDGGGAGAVWVFANSGSGYLLQPGKLTPGDETGQGAVGVKEAVAADGNSVLIGGARDAVQTGDVYGRGSAWVFTTSPTVSTVTPSAGPAAGGTLVTIAGSGLNGAAAVHFGSSSAASFTVTSQSQITAVAPPGAAGPVDVTIDTSAGTSTVSPADRFTYATTPATTTTTTPTTTTTTTSATPPPGPVARIVFATILGQGNHRTLKIRIRVSEPATARLVLLRHDSSLYAKTFKVRGGGNTRAAHLPARISAGTAELRIALRDAAHHAKTYTTTLDIPS
jgi:hypothetical protein